MNIFQKCISLFIAVMTVFAAQAKNYEVASPSGDLRAVVSVTNSGTTLSVFAGETEVLAPSPISLTITSLEQKFYGAWIPSNPKFAGVL